MAVGKRMTEASGETGRTDAGDVENHLWRTLTSCGASSTA